MRIRFAVPDAHVTPEILNAALEATTLANQAMLASGEARPISELIKKGKVKWKPEPFTDGEHFDLSDEVQKRGWGDCDDLAPALAAELRETGRDEGARAIVRRSGPKLWHAVTELTSGEILDPSRAAGMGSKKQSVSGTSVMGLVDDGAVVGLKRWNGKWASRCDLPIDGEQTSVCGLALCGDALDAITGAVESAVVVGGVAGVHPDDIIRALAVQHACAGEDYGDTLRALNGYIDGDELGSIFSKIAHGLKSALPMAANFIPIPGAGLAAQMATKLIPGGSKGHPGAAPSAAAPGAGGFQPPHFEDWALQIKKGVSVTRQPNGAFVVRF
jgi:hypothetical protein